MSEPFKMYYNVSFFANKRKKEKKKKYVACLALALPHISRCFFPIPGIDSKIDSRPMGIPGPAGFLKKMSSSNA